MNDSVCQSIYAYEHLSDIFTFSVILGGENMAVITIDGIRLEVPDN